MALACDAMSTLEARPKSACRWDLVSLGEVMLRLDPGEGRIHTTRRFEAWEGGGEYNVARGLKRCFGLDTTIVTALVDNPVGRLVQDLIYQGGDPMYSTTTNLADPRSWTAPRPFYAAAPDIVKDEKGQAAWLDFWIICDDRKCHLFFTNDNGSFFRAETSIERFPQGFSTPVLAMKTERREDLFEASNTYKIEGTGQYLTLIEAMGPTGRYFRAWLADRLDGEWRPIPGSAMNRFAGAENLKFSGRVWSEGVSHGEMIRAGVDQTLTIDPTIPAAAQLAQRLGMRRY